MKMKSMEGIKHSDRGLYRYENIYQFSLISFPHSLCSKSIAPNLHLTWKQFMINKRNTNLFDDMRNKKFN